MGFSADRSSGAKDGSPLAAWFDFIDMRANGFEFHAQLLDGKVSYNDANVRRAFAMWKQLIDAKCFDPNALAVDEHNAEAQLYGGRAGMLLMGTVVSASFPEVVRPVIDYQRFPNIDASQAAAEAAPTDTLHVSARAHNKGDARRFLKFAGSSAAQRQAWRQVAGLVPDQQVRACRRHGARPGLVQGADRRQGQHRAGLRPRRAGRHGRRRHQGLPGSSPRQAVDQMYAR